MFKNFEYRFKFFKWYGHTFGFKWAMSILETLRWPRSLLFLNNFTMLDCDNLRAQITISHPFDLWFGVTPFQRWVHQCLILFGLRELTGSRLGRFTIGWCSFLRSGSTIKFYRLLSDIPIIVQEELLSAMHSRLRRYIWEAFVSLKLGITKWLNLSIVIWSLMNPTSLITMRTKVILTLNSSSINSCLSARIWLVKLLLLRRVLKEIFVFILTTTLVQSEKSIFRLLSNKLNLIPIFTILQASCLVGCQGLKLLWQIVVNFTRAKHRSSSMFRYLMAYLTQHTN